MEESLFNIELPVVKNDKELKELISKYPDFDSYFIASGSIPERKEFFDDLWNEFKPLADSHFLSEVKYNFHQRTWEMYVGCIFQKKFNSVSSSDEGPDFVIKPSEEDEIFVEAVACERGEGVNAVPRVNLGLAQEVPENKMLLRIKNSLTTKKKKHKKFIQDKEKPYVIAINSGELDFLDPGIPLIIKCLFNIGNQQYKKVNGELIFNGWSKKGSIKKENEEKISMDFFNKKENDLVSAVIYLPKNILNSSKDIDEDCILIHNPSAKHPIKFDTFSFLTQFKRIPTKDGFKIEEF